MLPILAQMSDGEKASLSLAVCKRFERRYKKAVLDRNSPKIVRSAKSLFYIM